MKGTLGRARPPAGPHRAARGSRLLPSLLPDETSDWILHQVGGNLVVRPEEEGRFLRDPVTTLVHMEPRQEISPHA